MKYISVPQTPSSFITKWTNHLIGFWCTVLVFLVPFFPDEKLIRAKLQVFEYGVFGLLILTALRLFIPSSRRALYTAPIKPEVQSEIRRMVKHGFILLGFFVAWFFLNALLWGWSSDKPLADAEMRRVWFGAGCFAAVVFGGMDKKWIERILWGWALGGGLLAVYGLLQKTGGVGMILVPKLNRIFGTYGNPNFFASFLLTALAVAAALISTLRSRALKNLLGGFMVLELAALYLTKTRAAWLGCLITVAIFLALKFSRRKIPGRYWVFLILCLGGIFTFTGKIWFRDQGHLLIWRDTIRMWSDHPWRGVGLGAFHVDFPAYAQDDLKAKWPQGKCIVNYAHSEYIQTLAEGGIFLLLIFLGFIMGFFGMVRAHQNLRSIEVSRGPPLFLALGCGALLIQNAFSVDMRFSVSFGAFFFLAGLASRYIFSELPVTSMPAHEKIPLFYRILFSSGWIAFLLFFISPSLLQPYRANKEFSQQVDFFDARLLDPAKSIQDLEVLAKKYPQEPAVRERLAYVYAKEMMTADKKINPEMASLAVQAYDRLVTLDPGHAAGYNNYANVLYTLGRTEEAIVMWQKAVEVRPDFTDVHLNLGKIFYTRGKLKEAAQHFQSVLKIDPQNAEATIYLKRMVE